MSKGKSGREINPGKHINILFCFIYLINSEICLLLVCAVHTDSGTPQPVVLWFIIVDLCRSCSRGSITRAPVLCNMSYSYSAVAEV